MLLKISQDTINAGEKIAADLKGGDILLLEGELGAGKTTLVKGIALGLGIEKEITSPTFTLMNIYEIPKMSFPRFASPKPLAKAEKRESIAQLAHIDTYRLKNEQELLDIGVEDYLGQPDVLCVIEWPEKISDLLKKYKTKTIELQHDDSGREIIIV